MQFQTPGMMHHLVGGTTSSKSSKPRTILLLCRESAITDFHIQKIKEIGDDPSSLGSSGCTLRLLLLSTT